MLTPGLKSAYYSPACDTTSRSVNTHCGSVTLDTSSLSGDGARLTAGTTSGPKLDMRSSLCFATWNILTMSKVGYTEAVVQELTRYQINITGITMARIPGSGECPMTSTQCCTTQVVRTTQKEWPCSLTKRLATLWLNEMEWKHHRHSQTTITIVYVLANEASTTDKDGFYNQLEPLIISTYLMTNFFVLSVTMARTLK